MKYIANIITIGRMFLSISLLYFINRPYVFITIYLICGISDVLDGIVARKTHTNSILGAKLDSVADIFMFGVITISLMILMGNQLRNVLSLLLIVAFIRIFNLIISRLKYHSFIMLHTWGNKITGSFVFITPMVYVETYNIKIIILVCIISIIAAFEEGLIHIISSEPDLNRQSIFLKRH